MVIQKKERDDSAITICQKLDGGGFRTDRVVEDFRIHTHFFFQPLKAEVSSLFTKSGLTLRTARDAHYEEEPSGTEGAVRPPDTSLLRYSGHSQWKESPRVEAAALRREELGVVMGDRTLNLHGSALQSLYSVIFAISNARLQ